MADQVVAGDQRAVFSVEEDGVGGGVAGAVQDLEAAVGEGELALVLEHVRDRRAAAPPAVAAGHRAEHLDDVVADAVAAHDLLGEDVVALGVAVEVLDDGLEDVERADLGVAAVGEDADQAEVVGVLVGDDDPLEVLDAAPRAFSAASSATIDIAEFGPTSTSVSGSSSIR